MKKLFSIIIITLLFTNCNSQKKTISKKPVLVPIQKFANKNACGDLGVRFEKTDNWYNQKNIAKIQGYDLKKSKSLEIVKQQYSMKNELLYYKKHKVDSLQIYYSPNEETDYILYIIKGKPTGYTINVNSNPRPSMYSVSYDEKGTKYNFIQQNIFLPKGNGGLKNYYYGKWDGKNQKFTKEILKEEGEIKNNFKFGEWKYYNKEGKIDSVKTYALKDSVDIRFPHCIFNKNEKCY